MKRYQVEIGNTSEDTYKEVLVKQVGPSRYTLQIPDDVLTASGVKDALLQISYTGDIGSAFINGRMISDNFANGAVWEISIRDCASLLQANNNCITLYITPIKEGANVNVESAMAARSEEAASYTAHLEHVGLRFVYSGDVHLRWGRLLPQMRRALCGSNKHVSVVG